jgi:hypothetical protein
MDPLSFWDRRMTAVMLSSAGQLSDPPGVCVPEKPHDGYRWADIAGSADRHRRLMAVTHDMARSFDVVDALP